MSYGYEEHCEFHYDSDADVDRYEACLEGLRNPHEAWVLSGRDVWYANPYYHGEPQPHPEDPRD